MSGESIAWALSGIGAVLGTWVGLELAYSQTVAAHVNRASVAVRGAVRKVCAAIAKATA